MLENTFLHVPGVGEKTERKIWENGVKTWDEFLEANGKLSIGTSKKEKLEQHLERSLECRRNNNYDFLKKKFPSNIHWRTYREMMEEGKCCFLDIETTGLDRQRNEVTVVGIYDGSESRMFVNGKNLKEFKEEMEKYDLVVTFNGKRFDIPFIKNKFPEVSFNTFHVDLMYDLRKLGYKGGLKKIERELGISRPDGVDDLGGREAVMLWKKYKRGNGKALKTLIDYNRQDIENLEEIMEITYEELKKKKFK